MLYYEIINDKEHREANKIAKLWIDISKNRNDFESYLNSIKASELIDNMENITKFVLQEDNDLKLTEAEFIFFKKINKIEN